MTKEEAFSIIFDIKQYVENNGWFGEEDVEALDMALDALVEQKN